MARWNLCRAWRPLERPEQATMTLRDISMDENRRDLPRLLHGVE
jgi:hypothetical protein